MFVTQHRSGGRQRWLPPRPAGRVVGCLLLMVCTYPAHLAAEGQGAAPPPDSAAPSPSDAPQQAYAVTECLARVLEVLDQPVDVVDLLRQRDALPPADAASATGLLGSLATHNQLTWRQLTGVSLKQLAEASAPMILLVKPTSGAEQASCHVFLEGMDDDHFRLFTGLDRVLSVSPAELASLWDGRAITFSPTTDTPASTRPRLSDRAHWVLLPIGCVLFLASVVSSTRRHPPPTRSLRRVAAQLCVVLPCIVAGAAAIAFAVIGEDLGRVYAAESGRHKVFVDLYDSQTPVTHHAIEDITVEQVDSLLSQGVLLVDARSEEQFRARRIKGSIGLSSFGSQDVRLTFAGVPRDTKALVYCIGPNCGRGHAAARAMLKAGFTNVVHLPQGWQALKNREGLEYVSSNDQPF